MARVALLCPDLMFASRVEPPLAQAGHEVTRFDGEDMARAAAAESEALIVDLSADAFDGVALVEAMAMGRELAGVASIGFYPHVDAHARRRALGAGFDMVVPRSRMARDPLGVLDAALASVRRSL